jgi:rhamnosyltransferase subunit B
LEAADADRQRCRVARHQVGGRLVRYLVVTLGSAGDLHPLLALARSLQLRGHDVEVMSNAPYERAVRAEGLAFTPLCSMRDHERTATHPDLWHPMRGFGVLWRHLAVPAIEPVRARIVTLAAEAARAGEREGPLTVLASPLSVGARIAREQLSFPLCSVYTAPANLRSVADPMFLGSWRVPSWLPPPVRHALWWGLDRWKLEPMARPALTAVRQQLGLASQPPSTFGDWIHSPDGGVTLFPSWFCERQPGWPAGLEIGDFPFFQASGDVGLDASLQAFLDAGPRPAVIFPGSAPGDLGRGLLRESLTACRALGLRAVALGPAAALEKPEEHAKEDREFVLRCAHAPLSELLPRASVFIHHGGIGSCAQGLRSRVPQLIRPFAFDQFDNAARIDQDGAGRFIPNGRQSRGPFLVALEELTGGGAGAMPDRVAENRRMGRPGGIAAAMSALDRWEARRSPQARPLAR